MVNRLEVDVVSDIICPWCFIGKRRLEHAGEILGYSISIRWHPFQLNPDMPPEGVSRREYRTAKFGSLEYSQRLDARVAQNGRDDGIDFRHDLMERTPNTFRGHVLLAAALQDGPETQNRAAERLFMGYFTMGEDPGDTDTLLKIARECGVGPIDLPVDLSDEALVQRVRAEEERAREQGVQGVPFITFRGQLVSAGAAPATELAARLREVGAVPLA